jgi:hypothetical protein
MRFMMMYKPARDAESAPPPAKEHLEEMGKLIEEGKKAGTLLMAEGLHPGSKGARVRYTGGNLRVIDGPFAETKEVVGGFAMILANSREEAIESAKHFLKVAGEGECEIRQVVEESDFV